MRFINLDMLLGDAVAQSVIDAAEAARNTVLAETDIKRRQELIDGYRSKWTSFRPHFARHFSDKCWYVECRNPGTDDDIDHFRPKGRVAEDSTHGGYWWEALNWRNFRLSSHRANRLRRNDETGETHGKGDHFPLIDESMRCRLPEDDIARELPILLDPTDPGDPPLLTFNIDGSTAVSSDFESNEIAQRRVNDSRVYLHLDSPTFKEDRQRLYSNIRLKVIAGDKAYARLSTEVGAKEALKATVKELIRMTSDREEYSRAARAYIRYFRDRQWVKEMVIPNVTLET